MVGRGRESTANLLGAKQPPVGHQSFPGVWPRQVRVLHAGLALLCWLCGLFLEKFSRRFSPVGIYPQTLGQEYTYPLPRRGLGIDQKRHPGKARGAHRMHPCSGKPDQRCRESSSAYCSRICRAARQDRKGADGPRSDVRFWSASRLTSWSRTEQRIKLASSQLE